MTLPPWPICELPLRKELTYKKMEILIDECGNIEQLRDIAKQCLHKSLLMETNVSNLIAKWGESNG